MTEAEWLACDDPMTMLEQVRGKVSARSLRLFAMACCRRWMPTIDDPGVVKVVEIGEGHADGVITDERFDALLDLDEEIHHEELFWLLGADRLSAARTAVDLARRFAFMNGCASAGVDWQAIESLPTTTMVALASGRARKVAGAAGRAAQEQEAEAIAALVREILGSPAGRVPPAPESRTSSVLTLARAAYEERALPSGHLDNARLAVLSDALEEAGCADGDLLAHLRSPGPHVRGCWALDLVLGKG